MTRMLGRCAFCASGLLGLQRNLTAGVNWHLTPSVKLQANYIRVLEVVEVFDPPLPASALADELPRYDLTPDGNVLLVDWEPATATGATFKVYVNPLVNWLWIGSLLFLIGIIFAAWPDRDRFVLSAGHGSMLLYALLHLAVVHAAREKLRLAASAGAVLAAIGQHVAEFWYVHLGGMQQRAAKTVFLRDVDRANR